MIHRALFGSIERFFGVLVEHYAGAFPAWLAPVQAAVLPVSDRHDAYAFRIADRLQAERVPRRGRRRLGAARSARASAGRRSRRSRTSSSSATTTSRTAPSASTSGAATTRSSGVSVDDVRRATRGRESRSTCDDELDRLWAGWRSDYVSHPDTGRDRSRVRDLPNLVAATDDAEALVLERTADTITVMNLYPYGSGHLMVSPIRHVASFEDLTDDEHTGLAFAQRRALRAISGRVRTGRDQRRRQLRASRGRGRSRAPARARVAALERRHELHDDGRRSAVMTETLRTGYDKLKAAWPH